MIVHMGLMNEQLAKIDPSRPQRVDGFQYPEAKLRSLGAPAHFIFLRCQSDSREKILQLLELSSSSHTHRHTNTHPCTPPITNTGSCCRREKNRQSMGAEEFCAASLPPETGFWSSMRRRTSAQVSDAADGLVRVTREGSPSNANARHVTLGQEQAGGFQVKSPQKSIFFISIQMEQEKEGGRSPVRAQRTAAKKKSRF